MSTSDTIFNSMAMLCSRREYCSSAILRKLKQRGLDGKEADAVLERLRRERFVDDARYASFFARDKSRLSGWGPRKIAYALAAKGIPSDIIDSAIGELDKEESEARMHEVLMNKWKALSSRYPEDCRIRLVRFALSRGYDYPSVIRFLDSLSR